MLEAPTSVRCRSTPVPLIVRLTYVSAIAILPKAVLSYIRVGPFHPRQYCPYDQIRVAY
jgi:hypothetical protein